MSTQDEEDAWRSIVENYGERARLDDGAVDEATGRRTTTDDVSASDDVPESSELRPVRPDFAPFTPDGVDDVDDEPAPAPVQDDEPRFVPETPPLPYVPPRRLLAWTVLALAPLTLVLSGALDIHLDTLWRVLLVLSALGAFGYLVATMSDEPRDPYDDGARV